MWLFTLIVWIVMFFRCRDPEASLSLLTIKGHFVEALFAYKSPVDHMHLRMFSDSSSDLCPSWLSLTLLTCLLQIRRPCVLRWQICHLPTCGQTGTNQGLVLSWVLLLWFNLSLGQYIEFLSLHRNFWLDLRGLRFLL